MKHSQLIIIVMLAAVCLPVSVQARRPMGTRMSGLVTQVDHSTRSIVFQRDDGRILEFVYATRAKFWHGGADASPAALKAGVRVRISLHQPLIGPNFVTQIEALVPPEGPSAQPGK